MSNYSLPGGVNCYLPELHSDLIIEYSRSPDKFPLNRYTEIKKVDKQVGYFVKMKNDASQRVVFPSDNVWADGADSPRQLEGNCSHEFLGYNCVRRRLPRQLGYLAVEQAGWDLLDQEARSLAMQMMTHRVYRVHKTLTTAGNWGVNSKTATQLGGGAWSAGTSSNPYVRKSINAAVIAITQATLGTVQASDLFMILNPNTASVLSTTAEYLDFVKQMGDSPRIWEAQGQYRLYGLPENLMGVNIVVDDTVYNSSPPSPNSTFTNAYTFPDNVAVILSKQKALSSPVGSAFSTFTLFAYEEFVAEVVNDVEHRRYNLYVTENCDDSIVMSPESGYLISTL